jgi:hypothetical protein
VRTPTPWERLDGMKHGLDSILEQAVQWEQKRIIDLLENLYYTEVDGFITNGDTDKVPCLEEVIALIKGEQK